MYFQPKQSLLFPASDYVREVIVENCKMRDDFGFVVLDGSLIHRIDTTTAKVSYERSYPFDLQTNARARLFVDNSVS